MPCPLNSFIDPSAGVAHPCNESNYRQLLHNVGCDMTVFLRKASLNRSSKHPLFPGFHLPIAQVYNTPYDEGKYRQLLHNVGWPATPEEAAKAI